MDLLKLFGVPYVIAPMEAEVLDENTRSRLHAHEENLNGIQRYRIMWMIFCFNFFVYNFNFNLENVFFSSFVNMVYFFNMPSSFLPFYYFTLLDFSLRFSEA